MCFLFSFFFFFLPLSFLGIVPFKNSQPHLSWTPLMREEGIFQVQASLAWGMRAPVEDKKRISDGTCRGTCRGPQTFLSSNMPWVPVCTCLPSPKFRDREHIYACMLSHVQIFATPWTIAHQTPLFMGFPREEYWSGCHFFLQGIFPTQESNLGLLQKLCEIIASLNLHRDSFWKVSSGDSVCFSSEKREQQRWEESKCAWRPGLLSKLRRSERTCYLLEPDICCCEMISSIKKPGHQLLLIQPSSWNRLLTILPACTDQAVPGTEHSQPQAASPLLPHDPAGHLFQVLHLCSWLPLIPLFGHSVLGTEPPVQAAFLLQNKVRLYPLVSVMQAWVTQEAAGGRVTEWSAGLIGGIHLVVLLWKLLISSGLDSDYPSQMGKRSW